jgi:hypothetical protein
MDIKENLQLFEQLSGAMEINGFEVNAEVLAYLQPYLDGQETYEEAVERLKTSLTEVK